MTIRDDVLATLHAPTEVPGSDPFGADDLERAWYAAASHPDVGRKRIGCDGCDAATEARALGRLEEAADVLDPVPVHGSGCDEHQVKVLVAALLPPLGAGQRARALGDGDVAAR